MSDYLHQYFSLINKKSRKKLIYLSLLFTVNSIADMCGIGMVAFFVTAILNPKKALPYLQNYTSTLSETSLVITISLTIVGLFFFKLLFGVYINKSIATFSTLQSHKLRLKLIKNYQKIPYNLILNRNSASLIDLLNTQTKVYSSHTLLASLYMIAAILSTLGIISLLFCTNFIATGCLNILFLIFYFTYNKIIKKKLSKASLSQFNSSKDLNLHIQHFFRGIKDITILNKGSKYFNLIEDSSLEQADSQSFYTMLQMTPRYLIEFIMVSFVILLTLMLSLTSQNPENSLPLVAMFVAAGARLLPLINQIVQFSAQIKYSKETVKMLYEELQLTNPVYENTARNNSSEPLRDFKTLTLENINYRYPENTTNTLHDINLEIKSGFSYGIIGKTGAGKTTLINLLIGLLSPTNGNLSINETITTIPNQQLTNKIAYIPQDIFLLDDTIKQNIVLGDSENEINEEKLNKVINLSLLKDVILELPNKLDTYVGENGIKLSGGQRQRVALARALYHNRDIIVMDEATSSLDIETENKIIESIRHLHGIKTLIVIAHRLSTLKYCDHIYKLEHGKIIESGSYEKIIENSSSLISV